MSTDKKLVREYREIVHQAKPPIRRNDSERKLFLIEEYKALKENTETQYDIARLRVLERDLVFIINRI